ncbi:hypothetical protein [Novosphingobium barchaimii]|uniref:hypothetical protein n=1 Tax=Novosphingobium barchaimii TaxID=1420591 RepID=UPI000A9D7F32|nr:hypothetical protein [Novosphingobium barchaimii]
MNAFFKIAGIAALATGFVVEVYALLKSGAAEYSETLNIGLLNDKTNLMMMGGSLAIVGAIFIAVGALLRPEAHEAVPSS